MLDLIVIGGGPAGYHAAERAARAGMQVCLFEKNALGGVCLNEGCIPSKALLYSAKILENARSCKRYGIEVAEARPDPGMIVKRSEKVIRTLAAGVRTRMKNAGVEVVREAALVCGKSGEGFKVAAGEGEYAARRLLICAGSQPAVPPIPGIREHLGGFVLTNREALSLKEIPGELVVIGGGVIGLEMAAYYNAMGSRVTVVEMLEHIGGPLDTEIADLLQRELARQGIQFYLQAQVQSVREGGVLYREKDATVEIAADKVLLAVGRRPAAENLGLETIGVAMERGAIKVDAQGRTNVEGVYAAGDCIGGVMLAHTAYREAEVAVQAMLGREDAVCYDANPSVIYTHPEVACVGLSEEEAKKRGMDYEVRKLSMRYSGRFLAENEGGDGLCKILAERGTHRILGVHMLGNSSSEAIWGMAALIGMGADVRQARAAIFPHPTVGEILRETLWEFED